MRTNKKKKHQTPVTQAIDSIIPTSETAPSQTTTAPSSKPGGQRQNRGKGYLNFGYLNTIFQPD